MAARGFLSNRRALLDKRLKQIGTDKPGSKATHGLVSSCMTETNVATFDIWERPLNLVVRRGGAKNELTLPRRQGGADRARSARNSRIRLRGTAYLHTRYSLEHAAFTIPVIAFNFCFVRTVRPRLEASSDAGATCLVMVDLAARD